MPFKAHVSISKFLLQSCEPICRGSIFGFKLNGNEKTPKTKLHNSFLKPQWNVIPIISHYWWERNNIVLMKENKAIDMISRDFFSCLLFTQKYSWHFFVHFEYRRHIFWFNSQEIESKQKKCGSDELKWHAITAYYSAYSKWYWFI